MGLLSKKEADVAMTEDMPKAINKLPAIVLSSDLAVRSLMAQVFASHGWSSDGIINADQVQAVELLSQSSTPPLLFIDVDRLSDPVAYLEQLASVCDAGSEVVVFGHDNRIQTYREIIALGVVDYLPKPLKIEDVQQSLEEKESKAQAVAMPEKAVKQKALSVAVIGARGGVGATSIALEIARSSLPVDFVKSMKGQKKSKSERQTVLLDLDVNFGCAALYTDIQPTHALVDALSSPERIDDLFLERSTAILESGIHLLAAEDDPSQAAEIDDDAVELMFSKLVQGYKTVVIDFPKHLISHFSKVASDLDHVLIVIEPNLASLRDAIRLNAWISTFEKGPEVHILLNKMGLSKSAELSLKDIEQTLGKTPIAVLPYAPEVFASASEKGQAVQDNKASKALLNEICKLKAAIFGEDEKTEAVGFLAKLLGRKS